MNLLDLDAFVRVARTGSLTAAAKALGVPKSTVGRRVARLEDALGVALLKRTGRKVALTDTGARLYTRAEGSLRELDDVERELRDGSAGDPGGTLRLTAPADLGAAAWFASLLASFKERYPGVRLDVDLTNRVVDLVGESFDLALRPAAIGASSALVARRLLPLPGREARYALALFASPAYLARRGAPATPDALAAHDCIVHPVTARGGAWTLFDPHGETAAVRVDVAIAVNDFHVAGELARAGAGVALLSAPSAAAHVHRGELVRVLPEWSGAPGALHLVWPATRHLAARVRAFVDHAAEHVPRAVEW